MRKEETKAENQGTSIPHKIWTVIGLILCIILVPVLVVNVTLIVKSYTDKSDVPSVGGYLPLIVLSDSMYPDIQSGDLILCHTADPNSITEGDVIAFFDPASENSSVVTHQVIEVVHGEDGLTFRTKGIANNTPDESPVPASNLVGLYQRRFAGVGNIAMFMQTTKGLILCVVIPLLVLIGYDILRRRIYERGRKQDTDALLAELAELRAQREEGAH